jgi:Zn-dependent peptidase ImmA (M78 family)
MRKVQKARAAAIELLEAAQITTIPIDVQKIAEQKASVIFKSLDEGISGALVPMETSGYVILVNDTQAPVRQRFTIAHELGHLMLHAYTTTHADRVFRFRDAQSSQGVATEEIEANQFAAELLMPRHLLLERLQREDTLEFAPQDDDKHFEQLLAELANEFEVSKQAMAIRLSALFS